MRPTTIEYEALRELAYQDPVCVAQFFHVPEVAARAEWPFSTDFATEAPAGYTTPLLLCMGLPTGNTQVVEAINGRSSIGTFAIPMVDVDGEVLRYLANPRIALAAQLRADETEWMYGGGDLRGYPSRGTVLVTTDDGITGERVRYDSYSASEGRFKIARRGRGVDGTDIQTWEVGTALHNGERLRAGQRVQLWAGYRGLTLDKFLPLAKMELRNVAADGPAGFTLHVADVQRTMRQLIFNGASRGERVTLLGNPITLLLRLLLSTGVASTPVGTVQVATKNLALTVPQPELILNGAFPVNLTSWTGIASGTGNVVWAAPGQARLTAGPGAGSIVFYQDFTVDGGVTYEVKWTIRGINSMIVGFGDVAGAGNSNLYSATLPPGIYTKRVTTTTLTLDIHFGTTDGGAASSTDLDDVSVKRVPLAPIQAVLGSATDFTVLRPGDWLGIDFNLTTEQVFQVDRVESATELYARRALTDTAAGRSWRRAGAAGQYDLLSTAAVGYHIGKGTASVIHPGLVIGEGGTAFTKFLKVGDVVKLNPDQGTEQIAIVQAIKSDFEFIPLFALTTNLARQPYWKQVVGTTRADGLALPAIFVDVAGLEALRDREFPDDVFEFSQAEPVTAKDFIEVELLRPLNCYPFITAQGQYGARRYKVIPPTEVLQLTEEHIVAYAWESGMTRIINLVEFEYDFDLPEAPNDFTHKNRLSDTTSRRDHGARQPVTIQSRGIKSAHDAGRILSDRALQLLTRFAQPRPIHRVAVPYSKHVIEPGDIVSLTHPAFCNLDDGQRGVAGVLAEVTDVAWAFGAVTLTVVEVGSLISGESAA